MDLSPVQYDYIKHIKVYFIQLMEMKSDIFEKFLDRCHIDKVHMHLKTQLALERGPVYLRSHTQYLSEAFIKDSLRRRDPTVMFASEAEQLENSLRENQMTEGSEMVKELATVSAWEDPDNLIRKQDILNDMKPVTLTVLEYGWLLKGQAGEQFIEYLSYKHSDSSIFNIKCVQTIINSQWKLFRTHYWRYQLVPYCFYFVSIVLFSTVYNKHTYSLRRTLEYRSSHY